MRLKSLQLMQLGQLRQLGELCEPLQAAARHQLLARPRPRPGGRARVPSWPRPSSQQGGAGRAGGRGGGGVAESWVAGDGLQYVKHEITPLLPSMVCTWKVCCSGAMVSMLERGGSEVVGVVRGSRGRGPPCAAAWRRAAYGVSR